MKRKKRGVELKIKKSAVQQYFKIKVMRTKGLMTTGINIARISK